jgi:hypothetical protein
MCGLQECFHRVVERIQECPLPPITRHEVRQAIKRLKANTALGADRLRPADLLRLPDNAPSELAELFNMAEHVQMWPHQLLHTIGVMRAKKDNGDRILGIMAIIARLWPLIREPYVQAWNRDYFAHWDAIAKGNSAFQEAYERSLHEEVAARLGIPHLPMLRFHPLGDPHRRSPRAQFPARGFRPRGLTGHGPAHAHAERSAR